MKTGATFSKLNFGHVTFDLFIFYSCQIHYFIVRVKVRFHCSNIVFVGEMAKKQCNFMGMRLKYCLGRW